MFYVEHKHDAICHSVLRLFENLNRFFFAWHCEWDENSDKVSLCGVMRWRLVK